MLFIKLKYLIIHSNHELSNLLMEVQQKKIIFKFKSLFQDKLIFRRLLKIIMILTNITIKIIKKNC